jgi:hypothetical protein
MFSRDDRIFSENQTRKTHMKQEKNAHSTPTPSSYLTETLACRDTAMNSYCRLFARGFFPILVEQQDGMFRVCLSTDERS